MPSAAIFDLDTAVFRGGEDRSAALGPSPAADALDDTARELAALRAERAYAEAALRGGLALAEGARDAVTALGAAMRLAAVTRLPRGAAEPLLAFAGMRDAFAAVIAADDRRRDDAEARWRAAYGRLAARVPGLTPARTAALVGDEHAARLAARAGLCALRVDDARFPLARLTAATVGAALRDRREDAPGPCTATPR